MNANHLAPVPHTDDQSENGSRWASNAHRHSYETGESSGTGSLRDGVTNCQSSLSSEISPAGTDRSVSRPSLPNKEVRSRRKGRQASSNAFLLHDAVATAQERNNRLQSRNLPPTRIKALSRTPEHSRLAAPSGKAVSLSPDGPPRYAGQASVGSSEASSRRTTLEESRRPSLEQCTPSPVQAQPVDVDSTQIVNMALNLSESRRIASTRRTVSRTHPPGLVPLPDVSQGSSLRQHLQQQRKSSRGGSPRPAQPSSPRIAYGTVRTSSPLQSSGFEAGHETSYRWHFTPSTLARAQKAKEQLELMAQYRRLLELLPPLTPENSRNLTSPLSTPVNGAGESNFGTERHATYQGRPYNPLQYIRNRKVRARERKVIDGEGQGFSDIDAVRTWVRKIAEKSSPNGSMEIEKTSCYMPSFPGATECEAQTSPESIAKAAARTRRPRVDWVFDPCDMIADAYWLEQDHHKQLIEDRHRRKIFPPTPHTTGPQPMHTEDTNPATTPYSIKTLDEGVTDLGTVETHHSKADADLSQVGTREKAKQKLHDIKGFHHRHSSSLHSPQDVLRLRRTSFSDLSESENEGKDGIKPITRRSRVGTLSSDPNDLLQKQMLEILAKEARESQVQDIPETVVEQEEPPEDVPIERSASSKRPSRSHSRKGSVADGKDAGKRVFGGRRQSPRRHRLGQFSLDFGDRLRHYSTDDDSSAPVSPQQEKTEHAILSLGNATLSPSWSRNVSPVRNRLLKAVAGNLDKTEKGDKEKPIKPLQRDEARATDEAHGKSDRRDSLNEPAPNENLAMPGDKRQVSPGRRVQQTATNESHKGHRTTNSVRLRDEQSNGLRGIFKAPRIDTVLRGGVSKLGDILWKKDGSGETPFDPAESTEESEGEVSRGRLRQTLSRQSSKRKDGQRQRSKHFFETMPQFHPIADTYHQHTRAESKSKQDAQPSRSHSRQSSRVDLLKPSSLGTKHWPSSGSPPSVQNGSHPSESDVSEAAPGQPRISDGVRAADRRMSSIMGLPQFADDNRPASQPWLQGGQGLSASHGQLTKREIVRMKALILSSGIQAMEISRRAMSQITPLDSTLTPTEPSRVPWSSIARLSPDPSALYSQAYMRCDLHPLAARHLSSTIQNSAQIWQSSVDRFTSTTAPTLHRRLGTLRSRIADDLSERTREAADLADETGKDLALTQPLKVKHVQDLVEKLMRRRRRRFRWTRRALWLGVEWVLVGFMWYVWFVVTILRLALGFGKGVWAGVRWLLWL